MRLRTRCARKDATDVHIIIDKDYSTEDVHIIIDQDYSTLEDVYILISTHRSQGVYILITDSVSKEAFTPIAHHRLSEIICP